MATHCTISVLFNFLYIHKLRDDIFSMIEHHSPPGVGSSEDSQTVERGLFLGFKWLTPSNDDHELEGKQLLGIYFVKTLQHFNLLNSKT